MAVFVFQSRDLSLDISDCLVMSQNVSVLNKAVFFGFLNLYNKAMETDKIEVNGMAEINLKVVKPVEIPNRYENPFLESVAKELKLSPVAIEVWKTRLSKENLMKQWGELTTALPDYMNVDCARKNYWGRDVTEALKKAGCPYQENGKKLWLKVREWLEQTKYEPWLWEMLRQKAQPTQQMGFLEVPAQAEVSHLGARHSSSQRYVERVKKGSELKLEMTVAESTHLTLLEQEPNGTVVCLCPSEYAPQSLLTGGVHQFPQEKAPHPTFAATEVGKEGWLALLTPGSPGFGWLAQSRQEALVLQPTQLEQVLDYVGKATKGRLLYTEYEVY